MPNNRIFYACQAVAIAKTGETSGNNFRIMHGVQSVGLNTNFTLEQAFELGQVDLYANEEDIAEVEVTIEKLIDGYHLLYLQAVGQVGSSNVVDASNSRCDVYLALYEDNITGIGQTAGTSPSSVVVCSGMVVSSVSYSYPVDGNATESLTLVGNDKFWNNAVTPIIANAITNYNADTTENDAFNGNDAPLATGLVRRSRVDIMNCRIPSQVCSQRHQGAITATVPNSGIQSINISADFGRENQLELGRFGPYNKYATFPFEVTCEFEVNAVSGDLVSVSGFGKNLLGSGDTIIIRDLAGTVIDLGNRNRLTGITYSGGDTGGGVATITYSYSTFNFLKVSGGGSYWS